MKRKCPICDTRSDVAIPKCRTCGYVFEPDRLEEASHVVRLDRPSPRFRAKLAALVGCALAIAVAVMVFLLAFGGSKGSPDIRASLNYTVNVYPYSLGTIVIVQLNGWLTNYGEVDAKALVTIEIFDGVTWHSYEATSDTIVGGGGMVWFQWSEEYPNANRKDFEVRYDVSAV
jgi:hypothetical protein